MKFNFNNKIVVITGGTHGIGLACCEKFLKNGAKVITFSRSEKNIKNAIKKFKKNFYVYKGDVTNIEFLNNFSKSIIKKFKYVSILVHNVGGGGRWGSENIFNTKKKPSRFLWETSFVLEYKTSKRC